MPSFKSRAPIWAFMIQYILYNTYYTIHTIQYTQAIVHTVPGDINAVAFSPTEPNQLAVSGVQCDIKIIDCADNYSNSRTFKVGACIHASIHPSMHTYNRGTLALFRC